jgi:hypothetical protein
MITRFFVLFLLENINMKKSITLMLLCILFMNSYSQTTELWSKLDRNNIYEDCMSYLGKYRNISEEQKESISLCYLDEVTKKYTKQDFQSKIEIEIKRIKEAIINQCTKNLGIDLVSESKQEPKYETKIDTVKIVEQKKEEKVVNKDIITKEMLVGKWKTDNNLIIEFSDNGKFIKTFLTTIYNTTTGGYIYSNTSSTGDWFLDEKGILTLQEVWNEDIGKLRTKNQLFTTKGRYTIISINSSYMKFQYLDGEYAGGRNEDMKPIQANRVN